ncbi:prepilin peptidase [Nocardioides sp.]|uniref:prepilin peptidase n=1 Tax=Nocardioides sp. TaxID=35761 RepID=UPI0035B1D212
MNETLWAALLGAVAGLGGLLVPMLIARVPEPAPRERDSDADTDAEAEADAAADEPPKTRYAEIAARPGLGVRSALVAAVAGALLGAATGLDWPLVWLLPLTPVAVALSVIDWHTRLLPRVVVVPATLAALAVVSVAGLATGERSALLWALGGMVGLRSFFWMLWFIRSAGMGFGDVRLAALVGLVLGWEGFEVLLLGAWIGFVSFALPGVALAVVRRDRSLLKKPFPYGPFMLGGALVGLVWGTALAGGLWG